MARRQIVTRTVHGTQVTVIAVDTTTMVPEHRQYVLPGKYVVVDEADKHGHVIRSHFNTEKVLKILAKSFNTENYKIVKVVDHQYVTRMYGMWEEDFIDQAFELDPQTRKPINNND